MLRNSLFLKIAVTALFMALGACTTAVQSNPPRTATEELLISTAAEHAAAHLSLPIAADAKIFVDNGNFEGTDSKYAIGAIRTALLQHSLHLVNDKKQATVIVETRSGALSIDRNDFLIGIPQFNVPVPFASTPLGIPQIAFYDSNDQEGVAKFAVTAYDAASGALIAAQDPQYGFSHNTQKTVLIFISWKETDAIPDEDDNAKPQSPAPETTIHPSPEPHR